MMNIENDATTSSLSMTEQIADVLAGEFDSDDKTTIDASPFVGFA